MSLREKAKFRAMVEALIKALGRSEKDVREAARDSLVKMAKNGEGLVEQLILALIHNPDTVFADRVKIEAALANAAEALLAMVRSPESQALVVQGVSELITKLEGTPMTDDRFLAAMARVLGHFPTLREESSVVLLSLLQSGLYLTPKAAAEALGLLWSHTGSEEVKDA